MSDKLGRGALPRLFRKLVIGVALAASPQAVAADAADEEVDAVGDVDRVIGVVLDSMVDRALAHREDVAGMLAILLDNMHPLDATSEVCETALSPHPAVRGVLAEALGRSRGIVGAASVLEHLGHDADAGVRAAAATAMLHTARLRL